MRLRPALAVLALLAACTRPPPPPIPDASALSPCRTGPDGGPLLSDRGIGGTGAPVREADRGIGGTGGPELADRGIGGTGIVGVITGFASVCLAGQEVALAPGIPVTGDVASRPATALRAGQVAVVEASEDPSGLRAQRILLRYEISGPVERVTGDTLRVAGQDVVITPTTWGMHSPNVGDWVMIAGLRRVDATIEATRIDARPPGPVLVHGILRRDAGTFHIGSLVIQRVPGLDALINQPVTLTGPLVAGALFPETVAPDLLIADPTAFFGPAYGVVFIEGYAAFDSGRLHLGQGFYAPARGFRFGGAARGVVRFERQNGDLRPVGLERGQNFTPLGGAERRFEPAPTPNRALRNPDARGRAGGGFGRGQRGRLQRQQPDDNGGGQTNAPQPDGGANSFGPGGGDRFQRGH